MNYRDLEIWKLADELVITIHRMTMEDLPVTEKYETGCQIRRSVKSIKANIAEGFGRRRYKQDFIHFLVISLGSNDETIDHIDTLYATGSLKDKVKYLNIRGKLITLGKKINLFIKAVEKHHRT